MALKRNKCLHVLNIYTLRQLVASKKGRYALDILIMCSDNVTDIVQNYRKKIFCICKIDLSYQFKFNSIADFEYFSPEKYNSENIILSNNVKSTIRSLSAKMLGYIKLRRHIYIDNIIEYKTEAERDNNVQVFINYYNKYIENRKVNLNNSLNFEINTERYDLFDPLPKTINIEDIINLNVSNSQSYIWNLYLTVMNKFLSDKENIEFLPIYNKKHYLIDDFNVSKSDNFEDHDCKQTKKIILYFWQLLRSHNSSLLNYNKDAAKFYMNSAKYLKVDKEILQSIINNARSKNKIKSFLNLHPEIYYNLVKENTLLSDILKQLFILLQYGSVINGIKDK